MSGGDDLLAKGDAALASLAHGEAEVVISDTKSELTRFAGNQIHQSVAERSRHVRVRLIDGGRIGVGEVRGHDGRAIALAFAAAEDSRRVTTESDVSPLPAPSPGDVDQPVAFAEATAAATPQGRAELVAIITDAAGAHGINAYGALSTSTTTTAIVTSAGVRRSATSTQASLVSVARSDDAGGYASRHSPDIDLLDVTGLAAEVVDTCERSRGATAIGPGDYEVILSPYAVTDLLEHLAWTGFSALAVQEHRSFMRIGEKLMSDVITIRDDARTQEIFAFPFDDEGVPPDRSRSLTVACAPELSTTRRPRSMTGSPQPGTLCHNRTPGDHSPGMWPWTPAARPGRKWSARCLAVSTSRGSGTCVTSIRCAR